MKDMKLNRRQIIAGSALIGAATAANAAVAREYSGSVPWQPRDADAPQAAQGTAYVFFTPEEARFVEAAVARLIPNDELGGGAVEAGVPFFIDRQLAGEFGRAQRWYMLGPWAEGDPNQGYQSRMVPAQMYRAAIREIDAHCRSTYSNRNFAALTADEQDKVLHGVETGDIKLADAPGPVFFELFLSNTTEGFFSDPLYGGNRDMIGWKLIGFPGAHYDYRPYVAKHGEKLNIPPVGIKGRPGWTPQG